MKVYQFYKNGIEKEYELLSTVKTISYNRNYEPQETIFLVLGYKGMSDTLINTPIIIMENQISNTTHYQCFLGDYIFTNDRNIGLGYIEYYKKEMENNMIKKLEGLGYKISK